MIILDYNPVVQRKEDRKAKLSPETLKRLEEAYETFKERKNLQVLKRRRKPIINDGDVFVLTLNGKVFYYGKVLISNIHNDEDSWINGCILVAIFRCKTSEKSMDSYNPNCDNLMIPPAIITKQYWTMGWFETIGNVPITDVEKNLDYGFFKSKVIGKGGCIVTASEKPTDHIPKYLEGHGVTTLSGIYTDILVETVIDPNLLEL